MTELVDRNQPHEGSIGTMNKERDQEKRHRPGPIDPIDIPVGQVSQGGRGKKKTQLKEDLSETLQITRLHEFAHDAFIDIRSIPVDLCVLAERLSFHGNES